MNLEENEYVLLDRIKCWDLPEKLAEYPQPRSVHPSECIQLGLMLRKLMVKKVSTRERDLFSYV